MVETSIQPVSPASLPHCLSTLTRAFEGDPIRVDGSPPLTPMLREPRSAT